MTPRESVAAQWREWLESFGDQSRSGIKASAALAEVARLREYAVALEGLVRDARQIVEAYAEKHPCWTAGIGPTQDPNGAHGWLARAALEPHEEFPQPSVKGHAYQPNWADRVCIKCGQYKEAHEPLAERKEP